MVAPQESVNKGGEAQMAKKKVETTARTNAQYITGAADSKKTANVKVKYEFSPPPHVSGQEQWAQQPGRGCGGGGVVGEAVAEAAAVLAATQRN